MKRTDLPVLFIHDLDRAWDVQEQDRMYAKSNRMAKALESLGHPVIFLTIEDANLERVLRPYSPDEVIIFNFCEDLPGIRHSAYLVALILEKLGFTFTGSPSKVLYVDQDKFKVKKRLDKAGIPTPEWKMYSRAYASDWKCFPAIVKPPLEHGSVGLERESIVTDRESLEKRIHKVLTEFQQPALVEDFINGREFRVSLLEDEGVRVLPITEIDYSNFDDELDKSLFLESKTNPDSIYFQQTPVILPADLSPGLKQEIEAVSLAAYRCLGCRDYAGIDLRERDGQVYVLDINPDPEITPDCSFVQVAGLAGYNYSELGSQMVNLAARRHPKFGAKV